MKRINIFLCSLLSVFIATAAISYPVSTGKLINPIVVGATNDTGNTTKTGNTTQTGNVAVTGNITATGTGVKFTGINNCYTQVIGAISASTSIDRFIGTTPRASTITSISLVDNTTLVASDSTYFAFGVKNRTSGAGTTVVVDPTTATNKTLATGGINTAGGLVLYTPAALTLTGTAADLNTAAGDGLWLNITKTSTPAALVNLAVIYCIKDR